jgi:hypothetical protein
VRLEKDDMTLVIDPGSFSAPDVLQGADAVLVTRGHVDHVVPERLRAAALDNSDLRIWTNSTVAGVLAGMRLQAVGRGDAFSIVAPSVSSGRYRPEKTRAPEKTRQERACRSAGTRPGPRHHARSRRSQPTSARYVRPKRDLGLETLNGNRPCSSAYALASAGGWWVQLEPPNALMRLA